MKTSITKSFFWLLLGPAAAFLISLVSRAALEYVSPDKVAGIREMLAAYPLGLLVSLLTPWGWLMYGGLLLMHSQNPVRGVWCTIAGSLLLGLFWPIWATFLVTR